MFRRFDSILSECLEAMRHGATAQDCIDRYPRFARKLAPQLTLAEKISRTPLAPASATAQSQAWTALQKRAAELRGGRRPVNVRIVRGQPSWVMPLAVSSAVVLSLAASSGGVMYAAQSAMPDSPLYRVKLTGEDLRLWFVFDDTHKANILLDQSQQRMEEINATVRQGDPVPENALSAMLNRNQRAESILAGDLGNTTLRDRVSIQTKDQEDRLLAIWPQVQTDTQPKYAEVVTNLHNTQLGATIGASDVASLRPEDMSGGILTISGEAQKESDGVWRVGGVEVRVDDKTIDHDRIQQGASASVLVARGSNGRLLALNASSFQNGIGATALVSGAVEQITDRGIQIAGQFFPVTETTLQTSHVKVGEKVQITLADTGNGLYASQVNGYTATSDGDNETVWFEGTIQGDVSRATSDWTVGGLKFQITDSTAFDARAGSAEDGARVQVEAVNETGQLQARRVMVLASDTAADKSTVLGTFDGYDDSAGVWTVSGVPMTPPDSVSIDDDPPAGSLVVVNTKRQGDKLLATDIKVVEQPGDPPLAQLEGTISQIDGTRWKLEFGTVRVASTSQTVGTPDVGKRVIVWGTQGRDGTVEGAYARILDQSPVVTPAPGATPSPTPYDITGAAP